MESVILLSLILVLAAIAVLIGGLAVDLRPLLWTSVGLSIAAGGALVRAVLNRR